MNGRPLDLSAEVNQADGILETWFLGRMGGAAIADVLFGKYNPSGKLTISFPRNGGQIPIYYNHFNTGRPIDPKAPFEYYRSNYRDIPNTPLFAFGHGLSYTKYKIDDMKLSSSTMQMNSKLTVTATVANTGNYDGYIVVQLYIRDLVGSITRPVKELKAFKRIYLKKGEKQQISFELTQNDLAFYNQQLQFKAEPGNFKVWVAQSSDDESNEAQFKLIE
jgi:beta-glucosidase